MCSISVNFKLLTICMFCWLQSSLALSWCKNNILFWCLILWMHCWSQCYWIRYHSLWQKLCGIDPKTVSMIFFAKGTVLNFLAHRETGWYFSLVSFIFRIIMNLKLNPRDNISERIISPCDGIDLVVLKHFTRVSLVDLLLHRLFWNSISQFICYILSWQISSFMAIL